MPVKSISTIINLTETNSTGVTPKLHVSHSITKQKVVKS